MRSLQINKILLPSLALFESVFISFALFYMIIFMSMPRQMDEEQSPIMIDFLVSQKTLTPIKEKAAPLPKPVAKKIVPVPEIPTNKKTVISEKNTPARVANIAGKQKPKKLEQFSAESKIPKQEKITSAHQQTIENKDPIKQIPNDTLPNPVPLFKLTDLPQFLHRETPQYPEEMRALGRNSIVILAVLIDRKGRVRKVTVLESGGKQFDTAAIEGMQASSFSPAKINGKTVAVLMRMPVEFRLL